MKLLSVAIHLTILCLIFQLGTVRASHSDSIDLEQQEYRDSDETLDRNGTSNANRRRYRFYRTGFILTTLSSLGMGAYILYDGLRPGDTIYPRTPSPSPAPEEPFNIDIATKSGSNVAESGYIDLVVFNRENKLFSNVQYSIDNGEAQNLKLLPSELSIPTKNLADGKHLIRLSAMSDDFSKGEGEIEVDVRDPNIGIDTIDYPSIIRPSMNLTITLESKNNNIISDAHIDFSSLSEEISYKTSITAGNVVFDVELPQLNAEEKTYFFPITLENEFGQKLKLNPISVFFQENEEQDFQIDIGVYSKKNLPDTPSVDTLENSISIEEEDFRFVSDEVLNIPIKIDSIDNVKEILIGFEGKSGYFTIPVSSIVGHKTESHQRRLGWNPVSRIIKVPVKVREYGRHVELIVSRALIRVRDHINNLGSPKVVNLRTKIAKKGALEFKLRWDSNIDMDLRVIDPNDNMITTFRPINEALGGEKDIETDDNCNNRRLKAERIYYTYPISGLYTVVIRTSDEDCNLAESDKIINYRLHVDGCNTKINNVYRKEASALVEENHIESIQIECPPYSIEGLVGYQYFDDAFQIKQQAPLGAHVFLSYEDGSRVDAQKDIQVEPYNDKYGYYKLYYKTSDVNRKIYLNFLANNGKIDVRKNNDGDTNFYRSKDPIEISYASEKTEKNIVIDADSGSGAFHIMTTMSLGYPIYLAFIKDGSPCGPRIVRWAKGEGAAGVNGDVSHFNTLTKELYISGDDRDEDAFDDSVILHEFGHLILDEAKIHTTGYGYHFGRIDPAFAFSEGFPTYLGQKVRGNSMYVDKLFGPNEIALSDDIDNPKELGTLRKDNAADGKISEVLVASIAKYLDEKMFLDSDIREFLKADKRSEHDNGVTIEEVLQGVVCPLDNNKRQEIANHLNTRFHIPWLNDIEAFCE